jgi:hypothetical protein
MFYLGKDEINPGHAKNIKWTLIFLIGFIILFFIDFFISYSSSFLYFISDFIFQFIVGFATFISILLALFIAFIVFLPVRELTSPREKDLLYIFATILILIPIITTLVDISNRPISESNYLLLTGIMTFFSFISLGAVALAALVYSRIEKGIKIHGLDRPYRTKPLLPRPKPIDRYVYRFYTRPHEAFIIILIVALILGTAQGIAINIPSVSSSGPPSDNGRSDPLDTSSVTYHDNGMLTEGDSIGNEYYFDPSARNIRVTLLWQDEADQTGSYNEPDEFSIVVTYRGSAQEDSGENQHGEFGSIYMEINIPEGEETYEGFVVVTITLVNAGDQYGPAGLPLGPLYRVDDSNDFEVSIEIS